MGILDNILSMFGSRGLGGTEAQAPGGIGQPGLLQRMQTGLTNGLFPLNSPELAGLDPATQAALQKQARMQMALGILGSAGRGGPGIQGVARGFADAALGAQQGLGRAAAGLTEKQRREADTAYTRGREARELGQKDTQIGIQQAQLDLERQRSAAEQKQKDIELKQRAGLISAQVAQAMASAGLDSAKRQNLVATKAAVDELLTKPELSDTDRARLTFLTGTALPGAGYGSLAGLDLGAGGQSSIVQSIVNSRH